MHHALLFRFIGITCTVFIVLYSCYQSKYAFWLLLFGITFLSNCFGDLNQDQIQLSILPCGSAAETLTMILMASCMTFTLCSPELLSCNTLT